MGVENVLLEDPSVAQHVKVLPVVLLSIIDHYSRRTETQNRVIGTLLGSLNAEGVLEVRSAFPVRHSETVDQVSIDMEYHKQMYELHTRVNPKEAIVGWYASGNEINGYSVLIHEFYSLECNNPVHLTLDTLLEDERMALNAYVSSPFGKRESGQVMFNPIKCEVMYHEAERVAMNLLQQCKEAPSGTAPLQSDLDHLETAVGKLKAMIATAERYVEKVVRGELPEDRKVGRFLLETVAQVPKFDPKQFKELFNDSVQDLLMVVYLANLTRSQLALADQLQSVL